MVEVSTSILTVQKGKEIETFFALEKAKTDYFHIDVMDGIFVEKNTYSKMLEYARSIKRISNLPLDVHLMVQDVQKGIENFAELEPNIITFHLEACKDEQEVLKMIDLIKQNNAKVGISIKPNTKVEEVYKFLPYIHTCLIMTVEPGKGGQTLIQDMVNKIETLKKYLTENNLEVDIEADGGINLRTCEEIKQAGCDVIVSGSAILAASDYKTIIEELKTVTVK